MDTGSGGLLFSPEKVEKKRSCAKSVSYGEKWENFFHLLSF